MTTEQLPLIDTFEASNMIGLSQKRLRWLAKRGRVPHVQLGEAADEIRFCTADLLEWIESHKQPATSAKEAPV
jgi:predicted DNA-binding transcriptional regulator AlpA